MALAPQKISAQTEVSTLADSDTTPVVTAAGNRRIRADNLAGQMRAKAGVITAPAKVTASASSAYQATGLNGNRHIALTMTGNTAITAPTFSGLAANSVYYVRYELIASGATRTPSFSGFTLEGGVDPARPIADGARLFVDTEAHTDGSGAVTLHRLMGVYDASSEPSATLSPSDKFVIADADDNNKPKTIEASAIRDLAGRAFSFVDYVPLDGDGTYEIVAENTSIGAVVAGTFNTDVGSCTVNVQIADKTGSTNWTPTGAASVTSMNAISASTSRARVAASGANTMQKSGTADRILQLVVSGSSGSPTQLRVEWEMLT